MSFLSGLFKPAPVLSNVIPLPVVNTRPPVVIVPPMSKTRILGVDTSHYEPALDWNRAKAAGCMWMYTKASEHSFDNMLRPHVNAARAAGVLTSAYHFFHANADGEAQAELFLAAVKGLKFDLPCILDWEQSSVNGMSREKQIAEASKWLDAVEKETGRVPWIYMGASLAQELKLPAKFARYRLIVARYGIIQAQLRIPAPWDKITAWQFTDALSLPGVAIGHHIDANYFLGSLDELRALAIS